MKSNPTLLSGVDEIDRQLTVGDPIEHNDFGVGFLVAGWDGYLQVQFESGVECFSNADDILLVASDLQGPWLLLSRNEAAARLAENAKKRLGALAEVRAAFCVGDIHSEDVFKQHASRYLSRKDFEAEKAKFRKKNAEHRQGLKSRVAALIDAHNYAEADRLYVGSCQGWWPRLEFEAMVAEVNFGNQFVAAYCSASLSELDSLYRNRPKGIDFPVEDFVSLKLPKVRKR